MRSQLTEKELATLLSLSSISLLPAVDVMVRKDDDAIESLLRKGYITPCANGYRLEYAVSRILTAWQDALYVMSRTIMGRQVGLLVNYDSFLCYRKVGDVFEIQHVMNEADNLDEWICRMNGLTFRPHVLGSFFVKLTSEEGKLLVGAGSAENFGELQKKYGIPVAWLQEWQTNMRSQSPGQKAVSSIRDIRGNREVNVLFKDVGDALYMCAQGLGSDSYVAIARGGTQYVVSLIYNL